MCISLNAVNLSFTVCKNAKNSVSGSTPANDMQNNAALMKGEVHW